MRNESVKELILLDSDAARLKKIFSNDQSAGRQYSNALGGEISKAKIVSREELPDDVITMHSVIEIQDLEDGEKMSYTLVYPWEADADTCKLSILAPVGTALIGYREGDEIEWKVPGGVRKFKVISVKQP